MSSRSYEDSVLIEGSVLQAQITWLPYCFQLDSTMNGKCLLKLDHAFQYNPIINALIKSCLVIVYKNLPTVAIRLYLEIKSRYDSEFQSITNGTFVSQRLFENDNKRMLVLGRFQPWKVFGQNFDEGNVSQALAKVCMINASL